MRRQNRRIVAVAIGLATVILGLSGSQALATNCCPPKASSPQTGHRGEQGSAGISPKADLSVNAAADLKAATNAIDAAIKAVQAGKKEAAIAELVAARKVLDRMARATAKHREAEATPAFANTRCPIMGSPIRPGKVTDNLTRAYQGKKVAFCCGGCPAKWDRLSDAQKAAALRKSAPAQR